MGIYNVKVTEYNNEIQVTFYNYAISEGDELIAEISEQYSFDSEQSIEDSKQNANDTNKEIENRKRSTRRSKQGVYELARANSWTYFATFTFDDDKIDRYDYKLCKEKLSIWLRNTKRRKCPSLEWLCVPEKHKDGAYHFHALLMGDIAPLIDFKGWNEEKYVFKSYRLGYSELECVRDTNRVSKYITKYISKDLLQGIDNARRYFYSSGVSKPVVKKLYTKDNVADFLEANFPDKKIVYVNNADYGQKLIQYIQLKENEKN